MFSTWIDSTSPLRGSNFKFAPRISKAPENLPVRFKTIKNRINVLFQLFTTIFSFARASPQPSKFISTQKELKSNVLNFYLDQDQVHSMIQRFQLKPGKTNTFKFTSYNALLASRNFPVPSFAPWNRSSSSSFCSSSCAFGQVD